MRGIKFKFIVDKKHITRSYTLKEILQKSEVDILEDMENCTCQFTESVNHCECESEFCDSAITGSIRDTGLKDKNRKEIYEGDIVQMYVHISNDDHFQEGYYIGKIVIIASKGACIVNPIYESFDSDEKIKYIMYKAVSGCRSEIIGNIHEDKNLLK